MQIKIKNSLYRLKRESFSDSQVVYTIYDKNNKAGSVFYTINQNSSENYIWLANISVESKYQSKGVGQFLFDLLYNDAVLKRVNYIEGKYFPTNEIAKPFYDKNGCVIEKEGYETFVTKYIPHSAKPSEYFTLVHNEVALDEQLAKKREIERSLAQVAEINARHDREKQKAKEQNKEGRGL